MKLIVYGVNTVREAILSGSIKKDVSVYIAEKKYKSVIADKSFINIAKDKNINIYSKKDASFLQEFGKEAFIKGIAAVAEYPESDYENLLNKSAQNNGRPFYLILDEITDPQNLGSIIRTANGAGVSGIIIPKANSVGITSSVAYVSQGALFYVAVVRVVNISRTIADLKKRGIWVAGLSGDAEDTIYDMDFNLPLALVVGSEGSGLRRLTAENCDRVLRIPMERGVNSLNASVSFAVAAYEVVRQRKYGIKIAVKKIA